MAGAAGCPHGLSGCGVDALRAVTFFIPCWGGFRRILRLNSAHAVKTMIPPRWPTPRPIAMVSRPDGKLRTWMGSEMTRLILAAAFAIAALACAQSHVQAQSYPTRPVT